jgi:hypothetical protein
MKFLNIVLMLALMILSSAAMATEPRGYNLVPSSDKLFVATAGEVILTFLSKEAGYSNDLYLHGTEDAILNNQTATPGTQYSLGSFEAGAELVFTMLVRPTGFVYQTGAAIENPDSFIHAAYDITSGQSLNIGFEDLFNGGDKDYDDLVFSLSNVSVAPVPEPETYALMAAGLMVLGALKRRKI